MYKLKTLFVNADSAKTQCSFYESGLLSYQALSQSKVMDVKYSSFHTVDGQVIFDQEGIWDGFDLVNDYDLVIFNYNHVTMYHFPSWSVYNMKPPRIMLSWEINPLIAPWDVSCYWGDPKQIFSAMAVPNPVLKTDDPRIIKLPRIVPRSDVEPYNYFHNKIPLGSPEPPTISTYGLPAPSKGLDDMVRAVNEEYDEAHICFHFPNASWNPSSINEYQKEIFETCKSLAKPGITVTQSHQYMTLDELIRWLNQSDILMFFYKKERDEADHGSMPSATDQAIAAKVPMAMTNSICAQHITHYTGSYPEKSLHEINKYGLEGVMEMYNDWSPENFVKAFDNYLKEVF